MKSMPWCVLNRESSAMMIMRSSSGDEARFPTRPSGRPTVRQSDRNRIIAVQRGSCARHQTGGGQTPNSHTSKSAGVHSTTRRAILSFPTAMDLEALQQRLQQALGAEFTVGPLLGQGGFAAVFRARDNSLNRDVAVKVLDVELAPSPTVAERFLREAQTVARIEHPHIVPIYKVGRQEEVFYIIMRCIDGPSLRHLLERMKKLSVGDAARIARQVADALAYAHSHDIVHRDIKPDNVLLDKSGHVLVTDFGIAKAAQVAQAATPGTSQLTSEGMIIGTPQYMSPEQASGDKVRVPFRRRVTSMFYKSLLGLSVAGCLLSIAFVAGAAVVAYTVFSKAPKVAIRPPVPDSLTRAMRARRALAPDDVALYAYQPAGQEDSTLLLLTRRRTVVVTPHGVRSYSRDSVRTKLGFDVRGGLVFRLVIRGTDTQAHADTVFRS